MKKKTLTSLVLVLLIVALVFGKVNATSGGPSFGGSGTFTLSMESTLKTVAENSSVIFKVTAKEIDMRQGLTTLTFQMDYPKDTVETIVKKNINVLAKDAIIKSFDEKTGKISITTSKFITSDTDILQVECKPKAETTGKDIVFTLKDIKGSNGSTSANSVEISSTVKIGTENIENPNFKGGGDPKMPDPVPKPDPIEPAPKPIPTPPKPEPKPKEDETINNEKNPDAGLEDAIVPSMIALAALAMLFTYRYIGINNAKIKMAKSNLGTIGNEEPFEMDIK